MPPHVHTRAVSVLRLTPVPGVAGGLCAGAGSYGRDSENFLVSTASARLCIRVLRVHAEFNPHRNPSIARARVRDGKAVVRRNQMDWLGTVIHLVLLYLCLGILVTAFRPRSRSILREGFRRESQRFNKALAILLLCVVAFLAVALWPIIWVANIRAASSEKELLAEIKRHLIENGRNITATDGLLLTYYQFIVDQLDKMAKERGEKLPGSAVKDVSLSYMAMKQDNLGFGWHVMLNRGLEIYRAEGVQALLQFLREEQPLEQTQEPTAQTLLPDEKQQLSPFGGGAGDSFETAVVVNTDNSFVGVEAEYAYIANQCGQPYKDWKLQSQGLQEHKDKPYDVLTIVLSSGETRTFYFDITKVFTR